ncbi:putative quinol monooxygenase [Robiginitalea sediminis]|uniref:putative quinol monooxygenase n=1 Tax=Robiginitalea sediminis TaxID=1982593 RepID=UPI000B4AB833|nr:antibiotic biosynthesis monooxygenase family protein [Robiginitalea sediminis]
MLTRIVKMTFEPQNIHSFERIFEASKPAILGFPGCSHVSLLQDTADPRVYFTYSKWESEAHLQAYRESAFFRSVWSRTKALFSEKPQAWSLMEVTPATQGL